MKSYHLENIRKMLKEKSIGEAIEYIDEIDRTHVFESWGTEDVKNLDQGVHNLTEAELQLVIDSMHQDVDFNFGYDAHEIHNYIGSVVDSRNSSGNVSIIKKG